MSNLKPVPVPDLTGKTVLVTGAGRGIGSATVKQLTRAGARVYAGVRETPDEENAARLGNARQLFLNVTEPAAVDAAIAEIARDSGRLDALVNNAGVIAPIKALPMLSADDLVPAFDVNVIGLFRMTMAALPLLSKTRGVIVNAGTGAATTPLEGWSAYCAGKAGLAMLTASLALEAGEGIVVLGLSPGTMAPVHRVHIRGAIQAHGRHRRWGGAVVESFSGGKGVHS